ncbi:uncharacterized protein LOC117651886 [Thrips palmi]|uniref:Uncharacterized protein LOC117651886 n=1 Tax=Thrips palmi TaxID=161013 RepID=A0A6P9A7I9_THRPL|nr:uncharacterized protein LOC117651886 [Thrips palmi]
MPERRSSPLESLPPEVLHEVLSYVPTEQFLQLRLLSHCWSRLVLQASFWRRRRLHVPPGSDKPPYPGILRLAPALGTLVMQMMPASKPLPGLLCLKALARGRCQIRFLDLWFTASTTSNRLLSRVLRNRRSSLQELHIFISGCASTSNLLTALEAVDALEALHTLKLQVMSRKALDFTFKNLRLKSLQVLDYEDHAEKMARDLLRLGRDTLLEFGLESTGNLAALKPEIAQCSKIAALAVDCCEDLAEVVPLLPALERVTIKTTSTAAVAWLERARRDGFSGKVHMEVTTYDDRSFQSLVDMGPGLRGVHSVAVSPSVWALFLERARLAVPPALVAECLQLLPAAQSVVLDVDTDWHGVLLAWSPTLVPSLRSLSIFVPDPPNSPARLQLAHKLRTLRPGLVVKFL